ncbi:MAG TPA: glycine zipper 2TM domain-containing protein [Rhodocyclaceae bacterium]
MNTPTATSSSLHPVFWIAGIAVTLFSLVGIASLTGLLPSKSTPAETPQAVATAPAAQPAAPAAQPPAPAVVAEPSAPIAEKREAPAPVAQHKTVKHKAKVAAALPPPAGAGVPPDYVPPAKATPAVCAECGVVSDIRQIKHEGQGSGLGAVGGGVVGGLIGNNIGNGNGRTLATIAGMAGGALLGNKIEKTQRETVTYEVSVHMEDGKYHTVSYEASPPWRVGDPVKVVNGTLVAR